MKAHWPWLLAGARLKGLARVHATTGARNDSSYDKQIAQYVPSEIVVLAPHCGDRKQRRHRYRSLLHVSELCLFAIQHIPTCTARNSRHSSVTLISN